MERRGGWREGGRCETREHGEEKQFKATRHTEGKVETAQVRLSPRPLSCPGLDPIFRGVAGLTQLVPPPWLLANSNVEPWRTVQEEVQFFLQHVRAESRVSRDPPLRFPQLKLLSGKLKYAKSSPFHTFPVASQQYGRMK